mmetsp:Transcript_39453/g.91538  ORF Transcript_39453/g.91538 Transcript_39453/m.91538 type:complete len:760 (-) Transcript_39453:97-2376(-)
MSPQKKIIVTGHGLSPLAWLLWALDVLVWLLSVVGPIRWLLSFVSKPGAVQVGDAWRLAESRSALLTTPFAEVRTVADLFQRSCAKYADRPACGTRVYLGEHKVENTRFPLKKFGETRWMPYREFGRTVNAFGAGLLKLGLKPTQSNSVPDMILIFEETCVDWATACLAAFTQSLAVATSYATLGIAAVAEAVAETGAKAVVCNIRDVGKVAAACANACPSLEAIIFTVNYSLQKQPADSEVLTKYRVLSVVDVVELGASSIISPTPPTSEHLAVIMYTSGSTGKPKGVMIRHCSAVASVAAIASKFQALGCKEGGETYIAYLPSAHILELIAEFSMFSMGCAVGFACPKTISSKGACRVRPDGTVNVKPGYPFPPGGIQEFRPTLMVAVPKIWDILKKGVEENLAGGSAMRRFLFEVAFVARSRALQQGRDAPLFKALVFSKLSGMLGGRLKLGISGGGPISAEVQNFVRVAFATPLLQGYALTETTCAGAVQMLEDQRCNIVGAPLGSVEMKLRSCVGTDGQPEVLDRRHQPYLVSDREHYGEPCLGRGEVLIRGPSVSCGYFKQPDRTEEVFDLEGWFRSGDVGVFTPDGALAIVDRLKNLVKLRGGEYIALEAMEKEYTTSPFVDSITGGVLCYGDGGMDRPVALVQASAAALRRWAQENGKQGSPEELCSDKAVEDLVLQSLVSSGKAGGLSANELLCAVALVPGTGPAAGQPTAQSPWTPENGCLTASNKLDRRRIQECCAGLLEPLRARAAK